VAHDCATHAVTISLNPLQRGIIAGKLAGATSVAGLYHSELRELQACRAAEIRLDSLGVLAGQFSDLIDCLRAAEVWPERDSPPADV
jgi:hypothetical protein